MACGLCAGALLLLAGCSSGDDSSDDGDSGSSFVNDATAPHDGSTDSAGDVTVAADAGHDSAADAAVDSSPEAGGDADVGETSVAEGGPSDAAPDAPADDGSDGGDAGTVLPAAVAIWEFQDTPGSTTAIDSSGNGHTATLKGTAAIVAGSTPDAGADGGSDGGVGAYGNYLQIDGTVGAFVDVMGGPLFDNSKSFTVSTWVYFPSFDHNYDELISADGAHVSVFELQLAPLPVDGGTTYNSEAAFPMQDIPTPGAYYYGFSTAQPSIGTWYHIAGVYDLTTNPGVTPGALSLYVNGVLQANVGDSRALGANPVAAVGDFIIGAGKYSDARTNGAVANYVGVRVYAQALDAAQVAALYALNGR
jgi:Concanavalin A-like lectin/glucanases superfamily